MKLIRNKDKIIKELNSDDAYKTLDPDAKNLIRAYCGNRINKIINREEKVMSSVREDFFSFSKRSQGLCKKIRVQIRIKKLFFKFKSFVLPEGFF